MEVDIAPGHTQHQLDKISTCVTFCSTFIFGPTLVRQDFNGHYIFCSRRCACCGERKRDKERESVGDQDPPSDHWPPSDPTQPPSPFCTVDIV